MRVFWDISKRIGTSSNLLLTNNNLTVTNTDNNSGYLSNKILTSGKWYCEFKIETSSYVYQGIYVVNSNFLTTLTNNYIGFQLKDKNYVNETGTKTKYTTKTVVFNDIISVALDIDNKKIKFAINGAWEAEKTLPTWSNYLFGIFNDYPGSVSTTARFKYSSFTYPIPEGYESYEEPIYLDQEQEFSEYNYLLKKDNTFYSINPSYYTNGTFTPVETLTDIKNDFKNKGFNHLASLDMEDDQGNVLKDKLTAIGDGKFKVYSYKKRYNVIFDPDGGSIIPSQEVKSNELVPVPPKPSKDGYIYPFYYKDPQYTEIFDYKTEKVISDIIIYTKWMTLSEYNYNNGSEVYWDASKSLLPSKFTLTNNNLTVTNSSLSEGFSTLNENKISGKWYGEFEIHSGATIASFGLCSNDFLVAKDTTYRIAFCNNNFYYQKLAIATYTLNLVDGDILSILLDIDGKTIRYGKNGILGEIRTIPTFSNYGFYIANGFAGTSSITLKFKYSSFTYPNIIPSGYLPYGGEDLSTKYEYKTGVPVYWDPTTAYKSNQVLAINGTDIVLSNNNTVEFKNATDFISLKTNKYVTSGKYYWEIKIEINSNSNLGITTKNYSQSNSAITSGERIIYNNNGTIYAQTSSLGNLSSYTSGDTISVALDMDTRKIKFAKNGGTWSSEYSLQANLIEVSPSVSDYSSTGKITGKFTLEDFSYPNIIPSGFSPYSNEVMY